MSQAEDVAANFELVQLYRNNTIRLVSAILVFSLIILVIDVVLFAQTSGTEGAKNIAHTLSIVADTINIVLVLIEWNALYMYKEAVFKLLRYITPVGYLLVLASTVVQSTTKASTTVEAEEIVDVVCAAAIVLIGIWKGYKSYQYNRMSKEALNNPLTRSVLSENDYNERIRTIT